MHSRTLARVLRSTALLAAIAIFFMGWSMTRNDTAVGTPQNLRAEVCGTWLLHQVMNLAQLESDADAIDAALAQPGTIGLSLRVPWNAIDGDLTILERGLEMAQARNKQYSIRFMAGRHTPGRVFDAGAHHYLNESNQRVPKPFANNGTGGNPVFEREYERLTNQLADWSRLNGVHLLHMSWYGYNWAEIYNDTTVQNAPGYSPEAWVTGHRNLIDIAHDVSGNDLAVEFPLSGHWGGIDSLRNNFIDHMLNLWGEWNDQLVVQGNGLGIYDNKSVGPAQHIFTAKQMYNMGTWNWPDIYDVLYQNKELYVEVYLSSFQGAQSAQLASEATRFDETVCAPQRTSTTPTTSTTSTTTSTTSTTTSTTSTTTSTTSTTIPPTSTIPASGTTQVRITGLVDGTDETGNLTVNPGAVENQASVSGVATVGTTTVTADVTHTVLGHWGTITTADSASGIRATLLVAGAFLDGQTSTAKGTSSAIVEKPGEPLPVLRTVSWQVTSGG